LTHIAGDCVRVAAEHPHCYLIRIHTCQISAFKLSDSYSVIDTNHLLVASFLHWKNNIYFLRKKRLIKSSSMTASSNSISVIHQKSNQIKRYASYQPGARELNTL